MIDIHARAVRARIERWREAGLIDGATADRVLAFEATARPSGAPVMTVIGAASLALGLVALVSANWDALPDWAKLGGHVVLNLLLGGWAAAAAARDGGSRALVETLVLVLSASTLALIAHVGQSFQLQGDAFGLVAAWLALATPFTLAYARGLANRWAWTAGLFAAFALGIKEHVDALAEAGLVTTALAVFVVAGYAAALPARGRGALETWGRHLSRVMLGALVLVASAAQVGWRFEPDLLDAAEHADVLTGAVVATLGLLAAHVGFARAERGAGHAPERFWFAAFVVATPVFAALPLVVGGAESAVVAAVAFCLYWAAIAQLAHMAGRVGLYRFAVAVVALRVLVVFLEAFGGLLLTGVGLTAAGVLLLGFGYAVRRILKRPVTEVSP